MHSGLQGDLAWWVQPGDLEIEEDVALDPGVWLCTVVDVSATDVTLKKLEKRPQASGRQIPQPGAGNVNERPANESETATLTPFVWQEKTFRNDGEAFHDGSEDFSYAAKYDPTFPDLVRDASPSTCMKTTAVLGTAADVFSAAGRESRT